MYKSVALFLFCGLSIPAQAIELDIQADAVRWQYQEFAKDASITAAQASFLPSKVTGSAALLQLQLTTDRDSDWFAGILATYMDSTADATESWSVKQTNDLKVRQLDVRLDVQKEVMRHGRLGLWLSQRKQEQSRKNFIVNGAVVTVAGEPVVESITSRWVGVSFVGTGGNVQQLEARLDVGMPLQVDVTNPLFAAPFSKKTGYQTGVHFRWHIPKSEAGVSGLNLTLDYQYQELGGETLADGSFWPYNRWQTLGFGVLYAW